MGTGEFHSRVHVSSCIYGYWVVETKVGDAVPLLSILIAGSIAHISAVAWERKICNLNSYLCGQVHVYISGTSAIHYNACST